MTNSRYAIYGAGAMGTVLGAYLAKSEISVDLITRNTSHVEALNKRGAHIVGSVDFTVPVTALTPDEMRGKYDIIILMTKQRENAQTASFLKGFLADDGVICTAQNGLPEQSIAEIVGKERTVGCAVSWGATFKEAGVVALTSQPDSLSFALGSPYGENKRLSELKHLLSSMGKVTIESDFLGARWAKLAINSAFSPLSAMSGLTFGEIAKNKRYRALAQALLKEAFTVAEANGVKMGKLKGFDIKALFDYNCSIKRRLSFALLPLAMKKHKSLVSGMYYDLERGRVCDIDFMNGKIITAAIKNGVSAPVNTAVVERIHGIEQGQFNLGEQNLTEICNRFFI